MFETLGSPMPGLRLGYCGLSIGHQVQGIGHFKDIFGVSTTRGMYRIPKRLRK